MLQNVKAGILTEENVIGKFDKENCGRGKCCKEKYDKEDVSWENVIGDSVIEYEKGTWTYSHFQRKMLQGKCVRG